VAGIHFRSASLHAAASDYAAFVDSLLRAARNRPGHNEGGPRTEDFLPPGRVLEPSQVGEMVIAAMRAGERHIFTHPETMPLVEQHCRTLLSAYGCWTAKETTDL